MDIFLKNLIMKSFVNQTTSKHHILEQNDFKGIDEDDCSTMGLCCRKKIKRDQFDDNQYCLEGVQRIKQKEEEQKEQEVGINKYKYDMNKIQKEQQEDLMLEFKLENAIQYITGETLVKAMKSHDLVIYDCRYQYEFQGGHIKGAIHLNNSTNLFNELFCPNGQSKKIVVLYCEFSIKRSLEKYFEIRKLDRSLNQYPKLTYNNLYLLSEGYSKFFQNFSHLCNGYYSILENFYMNFTQQLLMVRQICLKFTIIQYQQKFIFVQPYVSMNDPAFEQQLDEEEQQRMIVKHKNNYRKQLIVSI